MELEAEYVHSVYDQIGDHFSSTRRHVWPRVDQFLASRPHLGFWLDAGCGNGQLLSSLLSMNHSLHSIFGSDSSATLLQVCHQQRHLSQLTRANVLSLPYRPFSFTTVTCIAVIHHLANEQRRMDSLEMLCQQLAVSGQLLVYVWARDAERANKHAIMTDSDWNGDVMVPWHDKKKGISLLRFYHLFEQGELDRLLNATPSFKRGLCQCLESGYEASNYYCIVERIKIE